MTQRESLINELLTQSHRTIEQSQEVVRLGRIRIEKTREYIFRNNLATRKRRDAFSARKQVLR